MSSPYVYYASHGKMSDPGNCTGLYAGLPSRLEDLVQLVQSSTIHIFWAEAYGLKIPPPRMDEVQLRSMVRRLERAAELDPRPLTEPRPLEQKLIGNCRDFSLLLVSLLRHQGLPARARCGFGAYFLPDHFEDHWVAEVWNPDEARWRLIDAQLDTLQQTALKINFDPLDVPRDQFIVAGKAWQMCRSGEQDPGKFGIFDMHGLGFVRGNVLRDLASLNKMELLPWDCWGLMLSSETIDDPAELALVDAAAALTAVDEPKFEAVRHLYESEPGLYMDGNLLSVVEGEFVPMSIG